MPQTNMSGKESSVNRWVSKISSSFESKPQYLIPVLQFVQGDSGYLPPEAMQAVARFLRVPESKVFGVASFYAQFHFAPRGKHTLTICRGTACHVRGSARLVEEMEKHLDVDAGGTTADLSFTLETVACVGACALAPLVVVDKKAHGRQTPTSLKKVVDEVRGPKAKAPAPEPAPKPAAKKPVKKKPAPKGAAKTAAKKRTPSKARRPK
jgi:NADH-quinone oxidoreductase subunit E